MPYIALNTAREIPAERKEKVKAELGRLIAIIPGKSEASLMVDFAGGKTLYMAGAEVSGAFVDLRLFRKAEAGAKKKFTEETFAMLSRELDIAKENIYLTIAEFDEWGSGGTLKA